MTSSSLEMPGALEGAFGSRALESPANEPESPEPALRGLESFRSRSRFCCPFPPFPSLPPPPSFPLALSQKNSFQLSCSLSLSLFLSHSLSVSVSLSLTLLWLLLPPSVSLAARKRRSCPRQRRLTLCSRYRPVRTFG